MPIDREAYWYRLPGTRRPDSLVGVRLRLFTGRAKHYKSPGEPIMPPLRPPIYKVMAKP